METIKDLAFNDMYEVIGWRLGDNDTEEYNSVLDMDYDVLEKAYSDLDNAVDKRVPLAYTTEQLETLRDSIGFVIDYIRAINNINEDYIPIKMNK